MSEEECLTPFQLQLAVRIVAAQDRWLQNMLAKLRRDKPDGWRKKVKEVRNELIRRSGRADHLKHRIRLVTESEEHV
jgi:hypothetical protein